MPLDFNTIANQAFRMAGLPNVDFAAETEQAELAVSVTERTIKSCLSRQEWNWAMKTHRLDRDDTQDYRGGYRYAFNLPGGRLSQQLRVMTNPRDLDSLVRDFGQEGRFLFCDEPDVYARFMVMLDPDLWPAVFLDAVVTLLASRFAVAAAQQIPLAQELERMAIGTARDDGLGGLLGQAAKLDAAAGANRQPMFIQDQFNLVRP